MLVFSAPEAPLSGLELDHCIHQGMTIEIRPQNSREVELGVSRLPEQEVGQPMLT